MRTQTELEEKIAHLTWYKQTLIHDFHILDMSAKKHALVAAFCRTVDNEIMMLKWALGQVEQTWTDDLSRVSDIQHYYEQLPPTEFVHLPYGRNIWYWDEKGITIPDSPGPYVEVEHSPQ